MLTAEKRNRSLAYERIAGSFDAVMNRYDLDRRIAVLIDEYFSDDALRGALALDAGAGTGWGAQRLAERGARVVVLDYGQALAGIAASRCGGSAVVADISRMPHPDDAFDVVFSSEVIEHTVAPERAVLELYRVVRPGGYLTLSTPNKLWLPAVKLGTLLRARPYDGYENFLWPARLRSTLEKAGATILRHTGVHAIPFQLSALNGLSKWLDRWGDTLLPIMINQCILAQKPR